MFSCKFGVKKKMFSFQVVFAFLCFVLKIECQQIHERENQESTFYSEDVEIHMTTGQIITHWGYDLEEHEVTTDDGYILQMQRIPRGKDQVDVKVTRPVVYLQHGLLLSSANWVTNLPHQSFGFLLADAGFDVWLGNARGNTYCRKHITLSIHSKEFWAFSWEQMAKYDLPAMVDYILRKTGQERLHYVGHSQGSLIMFAKAAMDDGGEFQAKIKSFTAMAPVARIGHMSSPLRVLASVAGPFKGILSLMGEYEFMAHSPLIDALTKFACETRLQFLCSNFLFLMVGFVPENLNATRIPVYFQHTPAGTSVQNMLHYAQGISSGFWRHYDFGWIRNRIKYGRWSPPSFDPKKVTLPVNLYWGGKDALADPEDVSWLISQLPNVQHNVYDANMDHLSYVWGLNAAEKVYHPIIKMYKEMEPSLLKSDQYYMK